MRVIKHDTYHFGKGFALVTEALMHFEVLYKHEDLKKGAKDFIKTSLLNRLRAVRQDLVGKMSPESFAIMDNDVLSIETALQLENVKTLVLALDKGDRDKVEDYAQRLLDIQNAITCPRGECHLEEVKGVITCKTCGHS
jgi:hypothetical protein